MRVNRYQIQAATDNAAHWLGVRVWQPIRPGIISGVFVLTVFTAGLIIGMGARDTVPAGLARDAIRLAYKVGAESTVLESLDSAYSAGNPFPLPFPQCAR